MENIQEKVPEISKSKIWICCKSATIYRATYIALGIINNLEMI